MGGARPGPHYLRGACQFLDPRMLSNRSFPALASTACLALVILLTGCAGSAQTAEPDELALLREDLAAAYAQIERLRAENQELDYRLRQMMERGTGGERGETVAVLQTDIFFESGSAELTSQGAGRLAEIARQLRADYSGREIRIEGYTDDRPIGPNLRAQYPSNWELSAARAGSVARYLQQSHNFDGRRIEIVGLGEYHPQTSNASPEGRQQNRRVRIAVMGS